MPEKLIIALSGKKRAGKDTFAQPLVENHGFTRVAFADPLRALALELNPIIRFYVDRERSDADRDVRLSDIVIALGWEKAKADPEVRRTLQRLGAGVRKLQPTFWIDTALAAIDAVDGPVVVTDLRYLNEAHALDARGATILRIERPGLKSNDDHASETELDGWRGFHEIVLNDDTVDELQLYANTFAKGILTA